jgi:hypothetical protein
MEKDDEEVGKLPLLLDSLVRDLVKEISGSQMLTTVKSSSSSSSSSTCYIDVPPESMSSWPDDVVNLDLKKCQDSSECSKVNLCLLFRHIGQNSLNLYVDNGPGARLLEFYEKILRGCIKQSAFQPNGLHAISFVLKKLIQGIVGNIVLSSYDFQEVSDNCSYFAQLLWVVAVVSSTLRIVVSCCSDHDNILEEVIHDCVKLLCTSVGMFVVRPHSPQPPICDIVGTGKLSARDRRKLARCFVRFYCDMHQSVVERLYYQCQLLQGSIRELVTKSREYLQDTTLTVLWRNGIHRASDISTLLSFCSLSPMLALPVYEIVGYVAYSLETKTGEPVDHFELCRELSGVFATVGESNHSGQIGMIPLNGIDCFFEATYLVVGKHLDSAAVTSSRWDDVISAFVQFIQVSATTQSGKLSEVVDFIRRSFRRSHPAAVAADSSQRTADKSHCSCYKDIVIMMRSNIPDHEVLDRFKACPMCTRIKVTAALCIVFLKRGSNEVTIICRINLLTNHGQCKCRLGNQYVTGSRKIPTTQ